MYRSCQRGRTGLQSRAEVAVVCRHRRVSSADEESGDRARPTAISETCKVVRGKGISKRLISNLKITSWITKRHLLNAPFEVQSSMLGHSDISATNSIYTHFFDVTHKKTVSVAIRIATSIPKHKVHFEHND